MPLCPSCDFDNQGESNYCSKCGFEIYSATGRISPDTLLEDRYLIVETIGRGGMGAVYKALDMSSDNAVVAIKEMSTVAVGVGKLKDAISAFEKEALMLSSLSHPALPKITDMFSIGDDRRYIVMEYIEGETLDSIVKRRGPIPEEELIKWAEKICEVLDYLHNQDPPVIFRDLKPANIMLTTKKEIKLIDFGIARHFNPDTNSDTTHYASLGFSPPEQYGEGQTDPRSDIYSLGATLHYLLTGIDPGKKPFHFSGPTEYGYGSTIFTEAIMKALEVEIEKRPNNTGEFLSYLNNYSNANSMRNSAANKLDTNQVVVNRNSNSRTVAIEAISTGQSNSKDKIIKVSPFVGLLIMVVFVMTGIYYYLPISELTLNYESLEVELGSEEVVLIATAKPIFIKDKLLIWESSNPSVAEVNNQGFIRAVDIGSAMITVSLEDGSKQADCKVEVVYPTIFWEDGTYKGRLVDDVPNGWGEWFHGSGESYTGYWQEGLFHGEGTHVTSDGQVFNGTFVNGILEGEGSWSNADGDSYIGEFDNGKKHGEGVYTWVDGSEFTGEFQKGLKHGPGFLILADGDKTEGEWKEDEYVEVRSTAQRSSAGVYSLGYNDGYKSRTGFSGILGDYESRFGIDGFKIDWQGEHWLEYERGYEDGAWKKHSETSQQN